MAYRLTPFVNEGFYHVFNRGVEKRKIFTTGRDYDRFLDTIYYYQFSGPKPKFSNNKRFKLNPFEENPKIVEIIAYCLMPNHFHLLLKQVAEGGIQEFVNKVSNSYTKYYNTKHNRVGALFQGSFKAVTIESDEQLLHVSRYIHLNPYVAELTKDLNSFLESSYLEYIDLSYNNLCITNYILGFFKSPEGYKQFVNNHADYALSVVRIKHLLLEDE